MERGGRGVVGGMVGCVVEGRRGTNLGIIFAVLSCEIVSGLRMT